MYAILTRPELESKSMAKKLESLGIRTLIEPMLTIKPCEEVQALLKLLTWDEPLSVITTSQHAIRPLASVTTHRDFPLYVVGESSRDLAEYLGFTNIVLGHGHASSLLDIIAKSGPTNHHYYYLSGQDITENIPEHLARMGRACQRYTVYRAEKQQRFSEATCRLLANHTDVVALFFSTRSAEAFMQCVANAHCASALRAMIAFTFSEKIATSLDGYPWREIVALPDGTPKTQEAFVQLIQRYKRVVDHV